MKSLELPKQLGGSWRNALILTYGANIPFFENALWGEFNSSCRNKVILADGRMHLESCAGYASESGLVRYMNQRYIAEGIFSPQAAHAKLVLLTNPEKGRLLVGSGNLNQQGCASGGEMFTQYDYGPDDDSALNAFLTVLELIEGLLSRGYLTIPAVRQVKRMLEETSWLYRSPTGEQRPVRHNLTASFLEQLREAVANEPVDELWVLAPFYDRQATALRRLLENLRPRQCTLLLQPGRTSVDPDCLNEVLDSFGDVCRVCSCDRDDVNLYIHAKLYLVKTRKRAVCLQGSPNLSQSAMLWTDPQGNIELANLLEGDRGTFDHLLQDLHIQPEPMWLDTLNLRFESEESSCDELFSVCELTGGEWTEDQLSLSFRRQLPNLDDASLMIGDQAFELNVIELSRGQLTLRLCIEAINLLKGPMPVRIGWGKGDTAVSSNPVFVCNRASLSAILEVQDEEGSLDRIGDLDLDDEEFEQLLIQLEALFPIDRRSIWQIAGRTPPASHDSDDEALRLDYLQVDYETLRRHPKLQPYWRGRGTITDGGYGQTRLQIILSAITNHFSSLQDATTGTQVIADAVDELEKSEVETEEEREEEAQERERRRQTAQQRIRRILKNFIRRYLRGLRQPDFRDLVGYEVIGQNYIIFSHILWRLFSKDWVEHDFVVESLLDTWQFFWGNVEQEGYWQSLEQGHGTQVLEWLRIHHSDAEMLASAYHGSHLTCLEHRDDLRLRLRDFWRCLLADLPFELSEEVVEEVWHFVGHLNPYKAPSPSEIAREWSELAYYDTQDSFLRTLEAKHGYAHRSCLFKKVKVRRQSRAEAVAITCLVVPGPRAVRNKDGALRTLAEWMSFDKRDYFRIACPEADRAKQMAYYDLAEGRGVYVDQTRGTRIVEFERMILRLTEWDRTLAEMQTIAEGVTENLGSVPSTLTA